MKITLKLLSIFLVFLTCHQAFSAPPTDVSPVLPEQVKLPEQHTKPAKNYFDIKADEKEGDRFMTEFMNMLTTLGLIVVIILIATWFLKKMVNSRIEQMNTTSLIKIIERRTITPKTSLYLIDIKGKGFILAESLNGVTSLGDFNVDEMEKAENSSFNALLKSKDKG